MGIHPRLCHDCVSEDFPLTYVDQEIELQTDSRYGAQVPIGISSALLRNLNDTARPCVRMAIEGASSPVGAPPQWLERASDIRTLGFEDRDGRSVLHIRAPKLGDAAPEVFEQQQFWPGLATADETAIQLIGKIGSVVQRQEAGSDLYDQPLLKHFSHWQKLFTRKVTGVQLPSSSTVDTPIHVTLDVQVVQNARVLSAQTPVPRQIRIVGKLDMVRHSTRSFGLLLDTGQEVHGVLQEADPLLLQQYFGREITVFGKAIYRPSGSLLRIDAQEIVETTEGRSAFSKIPEALARISRVDRKLQSSKSGVSAFFGTWPGEESDEELLAALGDLRR